MILSSGAKYNQINFSKNHVSGNARKIGVTVIWWFTYGHEGDPTDQSHGVGAVCDLRAPVCAKGAIEIKEGRGPWLLSPRKGLFPCLRQNGMSHVVLPKLFS